MSKSKPMPDSAANGATETEQPRIRNNAEVDAKIDAYIKEKPKFWAYLEQLPKERLQRMLVLDEVEKLEYQNRLREGVIKQINQNPEVKRAYEILVKNVPEDQREDAIVRIASQTRRTLTRAQSHTVAG